jgi:hypothetical protein
MANKLLEFAIANGMARDDEKIDALLELGTFLKHAATAVTTAVQVEHGRGERNADNNPDERLMLASKAIAAYLEKFGTKKNSVLGMSFTQVDGRWIRQGATPAVNPLMETARQMGYVK